MTEDGTTLVWLRRDLRIEDNEALIAAAATAAIIPVFIFSPEDELNWALGAASRWWLHYSLEALAVELEKRGSSLILRRGPTSEALGSLVKESGARRVHWNRVYESALIKRDAELKKMLEAGGIEVQSFNSLLLCEPWEIKNSSGKPFQVFTPFWRALSAADNRTEPRQAPAKFRSGPRLPSLKLSDLELLPKIRWDEGLREAWLPGERGAWRQLKRFLKNGIASYDEDRNRPDKIGTSRLSPHLHFGEISPRQIWHRVGEAQRTSSMNLPKRDREAFLRELGWREFGYHLLFHFSFTPEKPLREKFAKFPWADNDPHLRAWQQGRTGYPIVDAGMRELWHTGWMHNRVRMIVGSFLVKDLLLPWQEGEKWFWDTLVDADLASNTLGWQWIAGCGADAAPFFRVFNPVTQGKKFDPDGAYVRRWVRELAKLPARWIHEPWNAESEELRAAGVRLGETYPLPIVDHAEARDRALEAFAEL